MRVVRRTTLSLQSILVGYQRRVLVTSCEELSGSELGDDEVGGEKANECFPEHHCKKVWRRGGGLGDSVILDGVLCTDGTNLYL